MKRRIMLGTYVLSAGYYDAYYLRAQKVRSLIARDFSDAFQKVDAIITPTAPTPAFRLGEKTADPLQMYLADIYTVTGSLAGIPGISVPCGKTKAGLPIGMQILAPHFEEGRVLQLARAFRKSRWLHDMRFEYSRNSSKFVDMVPATYPLYGKYIFLNLQKLSADGIFLSALIESHDQ